MHLTFLWMNLNLKQIRQQLGRLPTWYSRRIREAMRQIEIDAPDMLVPGSDHLQRGTGAATDVHEHADAVEPFEVLQKLADHHHRLLRHGFVE